jgi:MFS family permease
MDFAFWMSVIGPVAPIDKTDRLRPALSIGRACAAGNGLGLISQERACAWRDNSKPAYGRNIPLLPITLTTMAVVLLAPVLPRLNGGICPCSGPRLSVPMVLTLPSLCVALLCPVAGLLGDRFGRRRLLLMAFVLYAQVGMAPLVLTSLWAILASRVAVGIAEALIYVLSTTRSAITLPARARSLAGRANRLCLGLAPCCSSILAACSAISAGAPRSGSMALRWSCSPGLALYLGYRARCRYAQGIFRAGGGVQPLPPRGDRGITIYGSVFFYTVQIQASLGSLVQLALSAPRAWPVHLARQPGRRWARSSTRASRGRGRCACSVPNLR